MAQDKVKQICDALKEETLEPAKKEAERLIAEATKKAKGIIDQAQARAKQLDIQARAQIEKEKQSAQAAMKLAARQTIESLKEKVEKAFFNQELKTLIDAHTQEKDVVAKLIAVIVSAIERDGVEVNLEALVPKTVSTDEINQALGAAIINRLASKSVILGEMEGGAQVKLVDQHMTLDLSDEALREMLARYIRDDFRQLIFS